MRNQYDDDRRQTQGDRNDRPDFDNRQNYGPRYSPQSQQPGRDREEDPRDLWRRGQGQQFGSGMQGDREDERYEAPRGSHYGDSSFGRGADRGYGQSDFNDGPSPSSQFGGGYGQGEYSGRGQYAQNTRERGFGNGQRGQWNAGMGNAQGGQYGTNESRNFESNQYGRTGGGFGSNERMGQHAGKGPKGYTRSDERIREDVSDRLTSADEVDASEIEVNVSNGEVTLKGTVDDRQAKRAAEDIAESVQGVRGVQNQIRVGSGNRNGTGSDARNDTASSMKSGGRDSATTSSPGTRGREEHRDNKSSASH